MLHTGRILYSSQYRTQMIFKTELFLVCSGASVKDKCLIQHLNQIEFCYSYLTHPQSSNILIVLYLIIETKIQIIPLLSSKLQIFYIQQHLNH